MAEGSRYSLYYVKETTSGITPISAVFKTMRVTQSSIDINIAGLESEELRDDAETSDYRLGARHVAGTVTGEMSFETYDDIIAAVLRSAWDGKTPNVVKGGILRHSFTMVDYNADLPTGKYTIYRGCEINTITLTVAAEAITKVEFSVVGRSMEIADAMPAGSTIDPRTTSKPMDGFNGRLTHDGTSVANVTEITLQIENGIEPRYVVGSKFSITPGAKRRAVSGSMNTYWENNDLRNKFLNEQEVNVEFDLIDPDDATKKYTFSVPRVKFTEAPHAVEGEGDIMLNISYRGLLDATVGSSIKVTKAGDTTP